MGRRLSRFFTCSEWSVVPSKEPGWRLLRTTDHGLRTVFPQTGIPDLDFPFTLVAAAGGQAFAVGAERHAPDCPGESAKRLDLVERLRIPDDNFPITRRGEIAAVRAEGDALNDVAVSGERVDLSTRGGVPELH